jgi:hypothetical protein
MAGSLSSRNRASARRLRLSHVVIQIGTRRLREIRQSLGVRIVILVVELRLRRGRTRAGQVVVRLNMRVNDP